MPGSEYRINGKAAQGRWTGSHGPLAYLPLPGALALGCWTSAQICQRAPEAITGSVPGGNCPYIGAPPDLVPNVRICMPVRKSYLANGEAQAVTCVHRAGTADTVRGDIWGSRELRLWLPR